MSQKIATYEARVRINRQLKMFHFLDVSRKRAKAMASKKGHVVSVRKVDYTNVFGNIENLNLDLPPLVEYVTDSPYESAIAMDEMIFNKRNNRLKNKGKDKVELDK